MLLKAIIAFFILVYIHISYSQTPATCLSHLKTEGWPRDGILRVEILRPGEKVPIREGAEDMSEELTMPRSTHKSGIMSIDPSTTLPEEEQLSDASKKLSLNFESTSIEGANGSILENFEVIDRNKSEEIEISISEIISSTSTAASASASNDAIIQMTDSEMNMKESYANESISKMDSSEEQYEEILKQNVPEVEKLMNAVLPDDQYVVECETIS